MVERHLTTGTGIEVVGCELIILHLNSCENLGELLSGRDFTGSDQIYVDWTQKPHQSLKSIFKWNPLLS